MKCVYTQPAYVLYQRPFRDTSALIEIFSKDYGRVSLIGRGVRQHTQTPRKSKSTQFHGILEPFTRVLMSWKGRTDLLNLTQVEPDQSSTTLIHGKLLFYGWYLNELLCYTLKRFDPHPELFELYNTTLCHLSKHPEHSLLKFEKILLSTLGYLPRLDQETHTGHPIHPHEWYVFSPQQGIFKLASGTTTESNCFQGAIFLALSQDGPYVKSDLPEITRLLFLATNYLLAGRKLKSRDLLSVVR